MKVFSDSVFSGAILAADAGDQDDALLCHFAFEHVPGLPDDLLMFMPGGVHTITPSQNGKPVKLTVLVNAASAAALDRQREELMAKGKRPYFDFNHEDREASFWPGRFFWSETPRPGVYARGERTASGDAGIKGKDWRGFSPVFYVDNIRNSPARVVSRDDVKPNMGGLVNDPAFTNNLPFWAKNADGAHSISTNNQKTNMDEKELAALQAKNTELQNEIAQLKAKEAEAKQKKENTALVEAELKAKEAELKLNQATVENEQLKAKAEKLETAEKARREKDADDAIAAAVKSGAIAAKDEDAKKSWKSLIVADPANAALLAKQGGNPALNPERITQPKVEMGQSAPKDAVKAFAEIVAKNSAILDRASQDKKELAIQAANFYDSELRERSSAWMNMPLREAAAAISAADVSTAALGTLASTLVLQESLPLFKYKYPVLAAVFQDFSSGVGLFNQTEVTRIIIKPAVTEYDPTLDANGRPKGFIVVTPAQTVDVPITLDKHVGVPMIFGQQTIASTLRDLVREQAEGSINALAGYCVGRCTALMTAANFNAYKGNAAAGGATTDGSTTITVASTANMYPGQAISGDGIPANTRIAKVTDGTHAELTQKATATAADLAFVLNEGKVPVNYAAYAKALADFNFASLGDIGVAFDTNEIPEDNRSVVLNPSYYQRLAQDPTYNTLFAALNNPEIIRKGQLPELNNFMPRKAAYFPSANNGVGFAMFRAAIALKTRIPSDFASAVSAAAPGSITTVTDPESKLTVLLVQRVDLVSNYAESRPEVLVGAAPGDRRAGLLLTSQ